MILLTVSTQYPYKARRIEILLKKKKNFLPNKIYKKSSLAIIPTSK